MKSITKLVLAGISTALVATGGVFANDSEWRTVDHNHGTVSYLPGPAHKDATIALAGHGKGAQRGSAKAKRADVRFNEVSTSHGPVSYFAPAK